MPKKPTNTKPDRTDKKHSDSVTPLRPPAGGAVVRMYRIGHGDCFLIAFAGQDKEKPAYVLIDCGYKPGSPDKLSTPTKVADIGRDILEATGGFVDVAIVTHEHQDHVNGFTQKNFPGLKVGQVWFGWTENPKDDVADKLRKKFGDRLIGLLDARGSLLGVGNNGAAGYLDDLLELELGEAADGFKGKLHAAAGGKDPSGSSNKRAMKYLSDCCLVAPEYLYPHSEIRQVPGARSARAFVLGPPRNMDKIDDLDPVGEEDFGAPMVAANADKDASRRNGAPFPSRYVIPDEQMFVESNPNEPLKQYYGKFFKGYYGDSDVTEAGDGQKIESNASWRRIATDDASTAGALALAMNNATNNTSLVLAFELSKGGKVLLLAGDAQAGNWRSWSEGSFDDAKRKVTVDDLLSRTVLYKVGHHGSHNATLKAGGTSGRASLEGMAQGKYAKEFIALITAVEAWALHKAPPIWNHPLPAIKQALLTKAGGRVLQTDEPLPANPIGAGAANWPAFIDRVRETPLYFDITIPA